MERVSEGVICEVMSKMAYVNVDVDRYSIFEDPPRSGGRLWSDRLTCLWESVSIDFHEMWMNTYQNRPIRTPQTRMTPDLG